MTEEEAFTEAVRVVREWMYERSLKRVRYATARDLVSQIIALFPKGGSGEAELSDLWPTAEACGKTCDCTADCERLGVAPARKEASK